MMSSTEQKRMAVESAYKGPKWKDKVKRMSDEQVVAIHRSLTKAGKIK